MLPVWELLPESEKRKLAPPEAYTVHPVVRESLVGRMTKVEIRRAHEWAAAYYGRPFVEAARRYAVQSGESWTEEETEVLARDRDGVVGQTVHATDEMTQSRAAMDRALAWRDHLFAAGVYDPSGEIVTAIWLILDRWGQRDRAKALLAESIATLEGGNKAVAQTNLASLMIDEGKLAEALTTYEAVYQTFQESGARRQMAAVLGQMASVYKNMGENDKAIEYENRRLALHREIGNEEGQAISLHQLSILHMLKEDDAAALARSQESTEIDRKRGNDAMLAIDFHHQGLIFNRMARAAATGDEAATHRAAALERFQASLAIARRIGDQACAASTLGELGKLWMDAGQMREAIAAFTEAMEIDQRRGNPVGVAIDLEMLGTVHERQGQYAAAVEKYQLALELLRKYGSPQQQAIEERHIARVRGKMGNG
jgi:tetratricopeptide (TPR) repeat protein